MTSADEPRPGGEPDRKPGDDPQPPPASGAAPPPDQPYWEPPYDQPYGQPPPYAQPPYAQPPYGSGAAPRPTNGYAIAAFVCSFLCSPLGLAFGFIALNQIGQRGDGGRGLAIAGIVISAVSLVLGIVLVALGYSLGPHLTTTG